MGNFTGVTFDEQRAAPSDDAIIRRVILEDGTLTGCDLSYTGPTLTMAAGHLMICGRQVKHPYTQNWSVAEATSGFARLLLTIDLTRTSSKDTFDQVVDTIEYASAVDGFADLVQDDINASGTKYQIVAAVVSLASGGISGIVSQLPQTSAGLGDKSVIIATAPTRAIVTCSKGDIIRRAQERNGEWRFNNLDIGIWTLRAEKSGARPQTQEVDINEFGVYRVELSLQLYPDDFIWEGVKGQDYEIVQDDDTVISVEDYRKYPNWKARILTSISITAKKDGYIDTFLLGAGASGSTRESTVGNYGAGGGSGTTKTVKNIQVKANQTYEIVIGSGGQPVQGAPAWGKAGGDTTAFGHTATGGENLTVGPDIGISVGGTGGSGGAGKDGAPGTDGSDGTGEYPGKGQNTTTREFGEPNGKLYANGGRFGQASPDNAPDNTGNGGDGARGGRSGPGSSGIVIIRNAR